MVYLGSTDLSRWLKETVEPALGDWAILGADWQDWLSSIFSQAGAIDSERLVESVARQQESLASWAISLVESDLAATLPNPPSLELEHVGSYFRVRCGGEASSHDAAGILGIAPERIAAEVATTVQDVLAEESHLAWPWCQDHDGPVEASHTSGQASWICSKGRHAVARIGELAG